MLKRPQEIFLDLIESSGRWNAFDGPKIAAALRANSSLWRAVDIGRAGGELKFNAEGEVCGVAANLTVLGGLLEDELLFDTLWAIPSAHNPGTLERLFKTFDADSVRWLPLEECASAFGRISREEFIEQGFDPDRAVLEAWWD